MVYTMRVVTFSRRLSAIAAAALVGVAALSVPVFAQTANLQQSADATAKAAGIASGPDLLTTIGRVINIALGTLGVIFLCLMLYAGYIWMTAGGDAKKVDEAKALIRNAVIGMVVISSAWAITSFVFGLLAGDGGAFGGGSLGGGGKPPKGLVLSSGALGNGPIESVLPPPNAVAVPRNIPIVVTFKEPVRPDSFIAGWTEGSNLDGLNSEYVKIFVSSAGVNAALPSDKARVTFTEDRRTYVIRPVDLLGSPTKKTPYTVQLLPGSGGKGILKANGSPVFAGAFSSGYQWAFEVTTSADLVPPVVLSAAPEQGGQYGRNIILQMTFSKPMDPTAVTGKTANGFTNLQVMATDGNGQNPVVVPGEFMVSDLYRTVEFVPDQTCGKNSCGQEVRCLPSDSTIQVVAKAATLSSPESPQAVLTSNGYDGVVSLAANSLDGNRNAKAEGPPGDNFASSFATDNSIRLDPPQIESTSPAGDVKTGASSNVALDAPVVANFSMRLRPSSLTTSNVKIDAHGKDEKDPDTFWWSTSMKLLAADGTEFFLENADKKPAVKAAVVVDHRPFLPSGEKKDELNFYDPYILQGVQSIYQTCFAPAATCGGKTAAQMGAAAPNCCNGKPSAAACASVLK